MIDMIPELIKIRTAHIYNAYNNIVNKTMIFNQFTIFIDTLRISNYEYSAFYQYLIS